MTQALPEHKEPARASGELVSYGAASGTTPDARFGMPFARELGALLERVLNREIAASTAAGDVLAGLDGESFAIEVRGLGLRCVLNARGDRVVVEPELAATTESVAARGAAAGGSAHREALDDRHGDARPHGERRAASATLRATPLDLLRLARSADVSSLKGTSAEIAGSPEIAERFAALLKLARPDLEDALARWVGDVPAHALARAAQDAGGWLLRAASALRLNTAEFLQEESRVLPAALEAQAFYADVERLRDDVERAAARLALLERRERRGSA
jgi:ubiquinone biosynthesis protein UbiJ